MGRNTTYKGYDLSSQKKYTFDVESFKGVDYTPSFLVIDDSRARDIQNIIYKDKVNQKRNGWQTIGNIVEDTYKVNTIVDGQYVVSSQRTNSRNINGMYTLKAEDGNTYTFAHIGKCLYLVNGISGNGDYSALELTMLTQYSTEDNHSSPYIVTMELADSQSCGFINNNRLFIFDGYKMLCIRKPSNADMIQENYNAMTKMQCNIKEIISGIEQRTKTYGIQVRQVENDEYTYVPITTIGITYKDSDVVGNTALDDVNLMTQWRKNKLVSGTFNADITTKKTRFWDWTLDTNIQTKDDNELDLNDVVVSITTTLNSQL